MQKILHQGSSVSPLEKEAKSWNKEADVEQFKLSVPEQSNCHPTTDPTLTAIIMIVIFLRYFFISHHKGAITIPFTFTIAGEKNYSRM